MRRDPLALVDDRGVRSASQGLGERLEGVDAARDLAVEGGRVEAVALAEGEERGGGREARDGDGGAREVARGRRDARVRDGVVGGLLGPPDEACVCIVFCCCCCCCCCFGRRERSGRKKCG